MPNNLFAFLKAIGQQDLLEQLQSGLHQHLLSDARYLYKHWEGGPHIDNTLPLDSVFSPVTRVELFKSHDYENPGNTRLAKAQVGCIVLCGGLGTRLGFNGPKGCFPMVENKSLFQLLFEKVARLEKQWNTCFPLALLVSSFNRKETVAFLKKNHFFGLQSSQITLLEQSNYPYFDTSGKVLLSSDHRIVSAPNGNGGLYELLRRHPLLDRWITQGVELIHLIPIDNPLADPFDSYLMGYMDAMQAEVGLKVIQREEVGEQVGLVLEKNGVVIIKDYMELPQTLVEALQTHPWANPGLYCFRASFLKKACEHNLLLPIHWIKKTHPLCPKKAMVWKGEKFAMDLLPYSKQTAVVLYPRTATFAPLKELHGKHGIQAVQAALQKSL